MQPKKKPKFYWTRCTMNFQAMSRRSNPTDSLRGSALLTALFIMTLVAIVAIAMTTRLQLDIYRARLLLTHDKMYLASQALTFWALNELSNKKNHFSRLDNQGMVAQFPMNMANLDFSIQITGGLYDLQGRFNLNNLIEKKSLSSLILLLNHTSPQLSASEKMNLAMAVRSWIIPYEIARGRDQLTSYYLSHKPPYFPSNQLMQSPSELRLVKNITAPIYQALEPLITTLPESTAININTAAPLVLSTLSNGLKEEQVNELLMARGDKGINNVKDISALLKKLDIPNEQITTDSHYFLSIAHIKSAEYQLTVSTYFKRHQDRKGNLSVGILHETIVGN